MKFLIKYWDKYQNSKTMWIKARNKDKAEEKFYKKMYHCLVVDIYKKTDFD